MARGRDRAHVALRVKLWHPALLESKSYADAIRLKANSVLYRHIEHLMTRPVGRPPKKPQVSYHEFKYRAGPWDRARRVVAKVERPRDELFPRIGVIVTNLRQSARRVIQFYNSRGKPGSGSRRASTP